MMPAAMIRMGMAVDRMPMPRPAMMLVAVPVTDCREMDVTGPVWVPV